jgi:hypothetical protein
MVIKTILIIVIVAILMEDGTSIRKTEEERKEDEELAKEVNRTLAEEKRKEDEEKKKLDQEKSKKKGKSGEEDKLERDQKQGRQDEACLPVNVTCPDVKPCPPQKDCPEIQPCPKEKTCPEQEDCPEVEPCKPYEPCLPCPVANLTMGPPSTPGCPEPASMSVLEAMAVGAIASLLLVTGVATAIGLLLRYTSTIFSGLLFIFIVVLTWYLSSHYPETARELGGRVVATLREASVALGHRLMAAIQRHHDQVVFLIQSLISSLD